MLAVMIITENKIKLKTHKVIKQHFTQRAA